MGRISEARPYLAALDVAYAGAMARAMLLALPVCGGIFGDASLTA
jgi:hypothetical protein